MPLGRCDACSTRLRFGSRTCERCGARKNRWKYLLVAVIAAEVATIVVHVEMPRDSMAHVAEAPHALPAALTQTAAPAGWLYYQTRDEMIDDTTRHARVLSRSNLAAGHAHDQGSTGVLELRASPAYGRSVVETCELRARFDTGDVAVFQASGSADPGNATLVVSDNHHFTERLTGAHTLALDAVLSKTTSRGCGGSDAGAFRNRQRKQAVLF